MLPRSGPVDFIVETDRGILAVEVKSKPSADAVWATVGRWQFESVEEAVPMMVAEWLASPALDSLNRAGWSWYDRRRGRLRLDIPGADINANYYVPVTERSAAEPSMRRDPLASAVGQELAVHLLTLEPGRTRAGSFREIAASLGRSASSVHAAMVALKEGRLGHR